MLKIHFLNVGHGDCTIIRHPSGHLTMIDINNAVELDEKSLIELSEAQGYLSTPSLLLRKSLRPGTAVKSLVEAGKAAPLTNPVQYLKDHYPGQGLFRYIQSHPDLDHMRGLVALRSSGIDILNFWDTEHEKEPDFGSEADEDEWNEYQELRSGSRCKVLRLNRGAKKKYFNDDDMGGGGDGISVLSPTPDITEEANECESYNDLSYVLKVAYKGRSVLLPGDAEAPVWDDLVQNCKSKLSCWVLKASHHGRDSGFHKEAVKAMAPLYSIVSVGKKPDTDATNKYRNRCTEVYSTRINGNITLTVNKDGELEFECERPDKARITR